MTHLDFSLYKTVSIVLTPSMPHSWLSLVAKVVILCWCWPCLCTSGNGTKWRAEDMSIPQSNISVTPLKRSRRHGLFGEPLRQVLKKRGGMSSFFCNNKLISRLPISSSRRFSASFGDPEAPPEPMDNHSVLLLRRLILLTYTFSVLYQGLRGRVWGNKQGENA